MKGTKPTLRTDPAPLGNEPAPDWLPVGAAVEWTRVMPILAERRILTAGDLGSLENYCLCIGRVRQLEAEIQDTGDTELMLKLFRAQDKAMASARLLAAELGLTPVSRSRPSIREEEDDADPLVD